MYSVCSRHDCILLEEARLLDVAQKGIDHLEKVLMFQFSSVATPYNPTQQPYQPPGQAAYPPQVAYGYPLPQDQSASRKSRKQDS